tara:strand:+ start:3126 stop:3407 length:282 start_codon:yes stop_codon:yes gene_type:complete
MTSSNETAIDSAPTPAEAPQAPEPAGALDDNPTNRIKNPSSPWTALNDSMKDPSTMKFFGPRFMAVWVMPIAVTGIIMEFLFVSPLRNINPFN